MNNNDTDLLQKIKDNAFYVALGVGLIAILAVVAVYTIQRNGGNVREEDLDLNQASDYSSINDDTWNNSARDNAVGRSDRRTGVNDNTVIRGNDRTEKKTEDELSNIPDTKAQEELQKKNIQVTDEADVNTNEAAPSTEAVNENVSDASDDGESLPVTADIGELNFGSGKTLEWPIKGEVILPYSMETTVYFKTLDQYQCNPGMLIAAGSGSTVKNAYLGKVEKVTSDNTYGNLITVYLGNDYRAVYGQLDTIYVKEGDFVKAGESIGTIGKPTDTFEEEGSHLFFQILSGDTPVDPITFME